MTTSDAFVGYGGERWKSEKQDAEGILRRNSPVYFRRNLVSMAAIAKAHGSDMLFVTWAFSPHLECYAANTAYQQGFVQNNLVVKDVAAHCRVPLYDFAAEMSSDPKYWSDGRHVNEAGALLKARLFANWLLASELLPKAQLDSTSEL